MFHVFTSRSRIIERYSIYDSANSCQFLHSDGRALFTPEYFPTEADAQAVLDKFYPKPEHVWRHGDVFESGHPSNPGIMMYIRLQEGGSKIHPAQVIYLKDGTYTVSPASKYLINTKFLFNIREKI